MIIDINTGKVIEPEGDNALDVWLKCIARDAKDLGVTGMVVIMVDNEGSTTWASSPLTPEQISPIYMELDQLKNDLYDAKSEVDELSEDELE